MKISLDWLTDFIELTEHNPQEIARRITAGVAEVDSVEVQGALLDGCVVGKILSLTRHPNADRLSVCKVRTDQGEKQIVCGGTNLREGMRVAVAHVGTQVRWHGSEMVTLERAKIRGEQSDGMICAAEELDLQSLFPVRPDQGERAILDFGDGDDGVGKPLREYLGLSDIILHIDNHAITHRADLFSHLGFAREFVALGLGIWKKKNAKRKHSLPDFSGVPHLPFRIEAEHTELVPRYCGCLLTIDTQGETPAWMKRRLEATGLRSISLPIDITNYVMTELGMPMHSFDADDFRGDLHIRTSKEGETITTLDTVERKLPEGAIVISDDAGIFDLLGIMGGLRSSTKDSTKRVYLHAAIVHAKSIRKAVIATGHRTDAATVYEKGVPPVMAKEGLMRALQLFLELVPGCKIASAIEEWGDDGTAPSITLPLAKVTRMLGTEIPPKRISQILKELECTVVSAKAGKGEGPAITVTPPLYRIGDLKAPHDIVEEIGRIVGYDAIPANMPEASIDPPKRSTTMHTLREALREEKFLEILPVSLIGPALLKRAGMDPSICLELESPLGEELSLLQPSTLPSLLAHAEKQWQQASGAALRTFHWGKVFSSKAPERKELSLLLAPTKNPDPKSLQDDPFLLLKRSLHPVLSRLGYVLHTEPAGSPPAYAHPGRYAELLLRPLSEKADEPSAPSITLGTLFEVHPVIRERFSLPYRTAAAVIDLESLLSQPPIVPIAKPVPLFPAISYDTTVTLHHRERAAAMIADWKGSNPLLESVDIVDLYSGPPLKDGDYNVTVRFTYRAADRTLTEEEARGVHEGIVKRES